MLTFTDRFCNMYVTALCICAAMAVVFLPSMSFQQIILFKCRIFSIISNMLEYTVAKFACWNYFLFLLWILYVFMAFSNNNYNAVLEQSVICGTPASH